MKELKEQLDKVVDKILNYKPEKIKTHKRKRVENAKERADLTGINPPIEGS